MNVLMVLSIASLFYISILGIIFFVKQRIKNKETKIYKLLIITLIVEILLELSMRLLANYMETLYVLNELIAKIFVYVSILWFSIITIYNSAITLGSTNKSYNFIKEIIIIINIIVFIILMFLPIEFYIIPGNNYYSYTYGMSVDFAYVVFFCLMFINVFLLFMKQLKNITKKYIPIILSIVLFVICGIIQKSNPGLILNLFVQSLVTFIMYHTIENPDVKMLNELELAKQNAERANEAKTDFLSSMSHEIRTPLNAIVGFSNSILEDETLEEAKTEAKDIIMASQNLLEIVNGILDISKIEAGKMEIVEVEYSLIKVLDNIKKLIIPRIGEKPIELKTNFSKDIPAILYGDMNKVREIITNLLTNAVKYTEKGIIDISVQCINTKNKSKLVISVEDTGRGIKPEKIDKLFTKFQRLEEDKNTTLEGTGLGLAITKSLVEMLGGKIVVQSKYGSGSKFTVYLEQKIIKMIEEKQIIIETENTDEVDYSNKKILIVDDNMLNIKVASRLLRKYQITPDTVLSGAECLDKIKTTTYDLILMDDMMPNKSGTETLQELKKDTKFNTPVIVLTANAISGMKEKYLKSGFTDYLAKPIDKLELDRVLKENLTKENKTKK